MNLEPASFANGFKGFSYLCDEIPCGKDDQCTKAGDYSGRKDLTREPQSQLTPTFNEIYILQWLVEHKQGFCHFQLAPTRRRHEEGCMEDKAIFEESPQEEGMGEEWFELQGKKAKH